MKSVFRSTLFVRPLIAGLAGALLLAPIASLGQNTATGLDALFSETIDTESVADGAYALYSNTSGSQNIAVGYQSLYNNTTGGENDGFGLYALYQNTTGYGNTAVGNFAGEFNTTANYNCAFGWQSLTHNNVTGNAAFGANTLYWNYTGTNNAAFGYNALYNNNASNDSAFGANALSSNTTGVNNTAIGASALPANTTGYENTALGSQALSASTIGIYNLAIGFQSGMNITKNENIDIANAGTSSDNGVIRIGDSRYQFSTYIAGISGKTASGGVAVYINANGQLGTLTSSRRFKNDIKAMGSVSEKLMQLRPVTFRYKDSAEQGKHALQYGLIAEEVAKVYPNLVQYDKQGKPFTIYYHLLTPMLLNELQKEHRRNVAQNSKIAAQQAKIASLEAALHTQGSELAAMKQSQQQQMKLLAKLAETVQTAQNKQPLQRAVLAQH
jgi:hypothetical protein